MAAPTCSQDDHAMEFHCPRSTQCTWWTCPECSAVYDLERGVIRYRDGHVEAL